MERFRIGAPLLLTLWIAIVGVFSLYQLVVYSPTYPSFSYGDITKIVPIDDQDPYTILFVGDVMLGRSVERLIAATTPTYPFMGTASQILAADISVANFEGAVPEIHVPTPNFGFRFSIMPSHLRMLGEVGFDVLSLANNHAYDFGESGYQHTRATCERFGITCVGHPFSVVTSSVLIHDTPHGRIGILFLHTLQQIPSKDTLAMVMDELALHTDIQIVYVHWGNEYEHTHSLMQERIAHTLIEQGADAIIGHHPHVVQDVAMYRGKPIFYSLGNFVFDQYFSDSVQEGAMVHFQLFPDRVEYEIIPVLSTQTRSQPWQARGEKADAILNRMVGTLNNVVSPTPRGTMQFSIARDIVELADVLQR